MQNAAVLNSFKLDSANAYLSIISFTKLADTGCFLFIGRPTLYACRMILTNPFSTGLGGSSGVSECSHFVVAQAMASN